LSHVISSVREFATGAEQLDDITALVLRFDAVAETTLSVAAT
jgi:hypothetical protein